LKIKIDLKWIKIEMETSQRHVPIFIASLISLLQIINMLTTKYDMNLFQTILLILAGLAGYEFKRRRG